MAVGDLLDEQGGYAEPAFVDDVALHQVGERRAVRGVGSGDVVHARPGVGAQQSVEGAESGEAFGFGVEGFGEFEAGRGAAVGVPAVHALVELPHFLTQRHSAEQVTDAGFDGGGGVAIEGGHGI